MGYSQLQLKCFSAMSKRSALFCETLFLRTVSCVDRCKIRKIRDRISCGTWSEFVVARVEEECIPPIISLNTYNFYVQEF